jgi:hypothetical protein
MINNWRTIHPISDKTSLLQVEEEGPPTYKELIPGATYIVDSPRHVRHGRIGFHYLSAHSLSYPNPGGTRASGHPTQGLLLPDKHDQHQDLRER